MIIIFGTNDIAQLANFYLHTDSEHMVGAFCVDGQFVKEDHFEGLPVVPFEDIDVEFPPGKNQFFAPLYDNRLREQKADGIKAKGYELISYVSSKATVWSDVGKNCFVMEDNTIQPFVNICDNLVMWSGNHIGHHSTIGDSVFFSSHVVLAGHCEVGRYCWFGINSTIRDHVRLSEETYVCMGASVTHDTIPGQRCK